VRFDESGRLEKDVGASTEDNPALKSRAAF
jgi:hypothetical protein